VLASNATRTGARGATQRRNVTERLELSSRILDAAVHGSASLISEVSVVGVESLVQLAELHEVRHHGLLHSRDVWVAAIRLYASHDSIGRLSGLRNVQTHALGILHPSSDALEFLQVRLGETRTLWDVHHNMTRRRHTLG